MACTAEVRTAPRPRPVPPSFERGSRAPNVLLILTDDQRRDGTMRAMPFTRRFFRRHGVSYPNAFVTTPLCCPSRASTLTGRYAHNHGVHENLRAPSDFDGRKTMQHHLAAGGYRTGLFGKYLNGWPLRRSPPFFDRVVLGKSVYRDARWNIDGERERISAYNTTVVSEKLNAFLRSGRKRQPWFAFVATAAPHHPYVPERKYARMRVAPLAGSPSREEADSSDKPPHVAEKNIGKNFVASIRAGQLRTLRSVDDLVRRAVKLLRAKGRLDNTLVIFTSDNGFLWGEHGRFAKRVPYPEATGVPLFLAWPRAAPEAGTDERLVANVDLMPTILDAAGIEPMVDLDGRSLLDAAWSRDRLLLEGWSESGHGAPTFSSLITPRAQYVEYYAFNDARVTFREYYDLLDDPFQLENAVPDESDFADHDAARALAAQLERDRNCAGADGPSACP